MLKVRNTREEMYISNTIEYDVKLCHVKTAIVNYTKVPLKGLKFNFSKKKMLVCPTCM